MKKLTSKEIDFPLQLKPKVTRASQWVYKKSTWTHVENFFWQLHLVHYKAEFVYAGEKMELYPGMIFITPPGVEIKTIFNDGDYHQFIHFYYEEELPEGDGNAMPVFFDVEDGMVEYQKYFGEILDASRWNNDRAGILLWGLFHRLSDYAKVDTEKSNRFHPILNKALRALEDSLTYKFVISSFASDIGVSQSHLNRLFKERFNVTVANYIRERRMERARHMLQNSDSPIKEVAALVGVSDLHLFNKTVRRHFGCSPRELRKQRVGGNDKEIGQVHFK